MDRELTKAVTERLAAGGWVVLELRQPYPVRLARAGEGGVMLVVELLPTSLDLGGRRHRPGPHLLRVGAGYRPALDLMPMLTLPARPALVRGPLVTVDGSGSGPPVADRIVTAVGEQVAQMAARFPDVAALSGEVSGRERLVLLAALGRAEEVRALLAAEPAALDPEAASPADRRFVRQLVRRLDQCLPPAPPVEQTLAVTVPGREPPPERGTLWATARANSRAKKAAYRAARHRAGGRTHDQIKSLIGAEFQARGVRLDPSEVALRASMIARRRRPLGLVRAAVAATATATGSVRDLIRFIRTASLRTGTADPEWLRPPDRAAYPVPTTSRYDAVRVDDAERNRLQRVRAEATRRLGPWVLIDAWLTRGPDHLVTVYIGQRLIGTVVDDGRWDTAFAGAALFDEDPVLTARLLLQAEPILELPQPQRSKPDLNWS